MDIKQLLYTGAFLNRQSSEMLKAKLMTMPNANKFPNVFCHHVTFAFKPTLEHLSELKFGEGITIPLVQSILTTPKVAMVIPMDIWNWKHLVGSGFPHITLATAEGVPPSESLNILKEYEENKDEIVLHNMFLPALVAVVGAHHRQKGLIASID